MKLDRVLAVRNAKTIYRDGDRCVKVFNAEYSKADVLNEALNQARVEETGLSIPRIHEVTLIEGKWAIVSDYIRGKTLAQMMQEREDCRDRCLEQFVDLQLQVHAQRCPLLSNLKDKMRQKIEKADLDEAVCSDLHARLEDLPDLHCLCHGDFNPSNVIITRDGTPYILDWSHASQGDGGADAASTYLLFCLNGDMNGAVKYLELFCSKCNIKQQDVEKWMPIVAAARSVHGNARERGFLLPWVRNMEAE